MTIELPDDVARLIEAELARGGYASPEHVIRNALKAQALRHEIQAGYDDYKAGRVAAFSARALSHEMDAAKKTAE